MAFRYLDQLGMAAKYHTKVYFWQTLIGGNYGLLNATTFIPNPDYYRQEHESFLLKKFGAYTTSFFIYCFIVTFLHLDLGWMMGGNSIEDY